MRLTKLIRATLPIFVGLLVYLLALGSHCHAQTFSINDILAAQKNNQQHKNNLSELEWISKSSPNTPWLENIEGRIQTDFADEADLRFALRFYPTGFGASQANHQLYVAQTNLIQAKSALFFQQQRHRHYLLILDYFKLQDQLPIQERLQQIFKDKIIILNQTSNKNDTKLIKILKTEENRAQFEMAILKTKTKQATLQHQLQTLLAIQEPIAIETPQLLTLETIKSRIQDIQTSTPPQNNLALRYNQTQEQFAYWRTKLENCENNKLLDFIETSYRNGSEDELGEAFRIEIGLHLPLTQDNQPNIQRRHLAYTSAKNQTLKTQTEVEESIQCLCLNTLGLISQYDALKKNLHNQETLKAQLNLQTPNVMITWQEKYWQSKQTLVDVTYKIYENFIELLVLTGKITHQPTSNALIADQEVN